MIGRFLCFFSRLLFSHHLRLLRLWFHLMIVVINLLTSLHSQISVRKRPWIRRISRARPCSAQPPAVVLQLRTHSNSTFFQRADIVFQALVLLYETEHLFHGFPPGKGLLHIEFVRFLADFDDFFEFLFALTHVWVLVIPLDKHFLRNVVTFVRFQHLKKVSQRKNSSRFESIFLFLTIGVFNPITQIRVSWFLFIGELVILLEKLWYRFWLITLVVKNAMLE